MAALIDSAIGVGIDSELGTTIDNVIGMRIDSELGTKIDKAIAAGIDSKIGTTIDRAIGVAFCSGMMLRAIAMIEPLLCQHSLGLTATGHEPD